MNDIDKLLSELEKQVKVLNDEKNQAIEAKEQAEQVRILADSKIEKVNKKQKKLEEARQVAEEAQRKAKEAEEVFNEIEEEEIKGEIAREVEETEAELEVIEEETEENVEDNTEDNAVDEEIIDTEEDIEYKTDDLENKKDDKKKFIIGFVSGVLVTAIIAGTVYLVTRESKKGQIKEIKAPTESIDNNKDSNNTVVEDTNLSYNYENNKLTIVENNEENEVLVYEDLTTENFENLVANYSNKYNNEYDGIIGSEDLAKFASIANIDKLAEDNPELIIELSAGQTKEEYLNDAAKVIGATVMNNFNVWNQTQSTEGFIKVSELISGSQQKEMIKIEEYTDRIAGAAKNEDADLVNSLVKEFITDLNSGELSKLDDGVGFAAQVNIAMISDGIARNYLDQENFDMLQILKTSEKYVSNIFTVYDKCSNNAKTLSRN